MWRFVAFAISLVLLPIRFEGSSPAGLRELHTSGQVRWGARPRAEALLERRDPGNPCRVEAVGWPLSDARILLPTALPWTGPRFIGAELDSNYRSASTAGPTRPSFCARSFRSDDPHHLLDERGFRGSSPSCATDSLGERTLGIRCFECLQPTRTRYAMHRRGETVSCDGGVEVCTPCTTLGASTCADPDHYMFYWSACKPANTTTGSGTTGSGWTCDPSFFGNHDGCHCGCGVVDPDCFNVTAGACDFCNEQNSCSQASVGRPGTISATNNAVCN